MSDDRTTAALDRLRRILRRAKGSYALVRVVTDDVARVAVFDALRTGGDGGPVLRFLPSGAEGAAALEMILRGGGESAEGIVVPDGNTLLSFDEGRVLTALNLARERLRTVMKGPLVLVLSPEADAALARRAPDLRDATLGVVRVEGDAPPPSMDIEQERITREQAEAEFARILAADLPDGEAVDALIALGRCLRSTVFDREEQSDTALIRQIVREALNRAVRAGYERGIANAEVLGIAIGPTALDRAERQRMLTDAIARLDRLGLAVDLDRAKAQSFLAMDLCLSGAVDEGLRIYREVVLPEVDRSDSLRDQIGAREALMRVLDQLGRFRDAALVARDEMLPLVRATQDRQNVLRLMVLAASNLVRAGDDDRAISWFHDEIIPLARALDDSDRLGFAYLTLNRAYAHRNGPGDRERALLYADFAKRMYVKAGDLQAAARADQLVRTRSASSKSNRAARRQLKFARHRV